jgi:hypothetical protein
LRFLRYGVLFVAALSLACGSSSTRTDGKVAPVYSSTTGRLEQLTADRDGDGKIDTRAFMDGVHLKYVELDLNNDGRPDRWEYYASGTPGRAGAGAAFDKNTVLERAEEAHGPDNKTITRREFYDHGVISRVEEDTDFDGRLDKWEQYENGALVRIDLDLAGTGKPNRRMIYKNGALDHMETDARGDGTFVRMAALPAPAQGAGRQ